MFGFGKVRCSFCDRQMPVKEALRARDWKDITICRGCYEQWEKSGRTCTECHTPVRGPQDVSAFLRPRSFGHADCGGVRLGAG